MSFAERGLGGVYVPARGAPVPPPRRPDARRLPAATRRADGRAAGAPSRSCTRGGGRNWRRSAARLHVRALFPWSPRCRSRSTTSPASTSSRPAEAVPHDAAPAGAVPRRRREPARVTVLAPRPQRRAVPATGGRERPRADVRRLRAPDRRRRQHGRDGRDDRRRSPTPGSGCCATSGTSAWCRRSTAACARRAASTSPGSTTTTTAGPRASSVRSALLDANPDVGLVGTWMDLVEAGGRRVGRLRSTIADYPEFVFQTLISGVLISHPSAMYRRTPGGRARRLRRVDDRRRGQGPLAAPRPRRAGTRALVPEPLVVYRLHDEQSSQVHAAEQSRDGRPQPGALPRRAEPEAPARVAAAAARRRPRLLGRVRRRRAEQRGARRARPAPRRHAGPAPARARRRRRGSDELVSARLAHRRPTGWRGGTDRLLAARARLSPRAAAALSLRGIDLRPRGTVRRTSRPGPPRRRGRRSARLARSVARSRGLRTRCASRRSGRGSRACSTAS